MAQQPPPVMEVDDLKHVALIVVDETYSLICSDEQRRMLKQSVFSPSTPAIPVAASIWQLAEGTTGVQRG